MRCFRSTSIDAGSPGGVAWLVCMAMLVLGACSDDSAPESGAVMSGKVTHVLDGDSVKFKPRGDAELEVRLAGVDAPEHSQPHAEQSRAALEGLLGSRDLLLISRGHDRYGRELAVLRDGDLNINRELVRLGHAWAYTAYAEDTRLARLQKDAEEAGRGLWSVTGARPIAPWDWRKTHKRHRR